VRYSTGQPISLPATVTDARTGALVNAGTLTLTIRKPDGTQQSYSSPANDSTGTYHQDVPVSDLGQVGHYQYKWTSTGTGAGESVGDFDVFDPFEVRVISLQDAKVMLNIPAASTGSDAEILEWIASIEAGLERFTGGPVISRAVTERCEALNGLRQFVVRQRPLVSVTSITAETGGALDLSDVKVDANAGTIQRALGWPFLGPFAGPWFDVAYVAGWGTAVPPAFAGFARIVVDHLWSPQRGPVAMPMGGADTVTPPWLGFAIPNRALELLNGSQDGMAYACEAFI
jgi:hypothetical protein